MLNVFFLAEKLQIPVLPFCFKLFAHRRYRYRFSIPECSVDLQSGMRSEERIAPHLSLPRGCFEWPSLKRSYFLLHSFQNNIGRLQPIKDKV